MRYFHIRKLYGLSREQYDDAVKRQHGRCVICRRKPDGKGRNGILHVDHCHRTGRFRALLCRNCNSGLGSFGDDRKRLAAAIKYLAGFSLDTRRARV
jgi:hypothetical protein